MGTSSPFKGLDSEEYDWKRALPSNPTFVKKMKKIINNQEIKINDNTDPPLSLISIEKNGRGEKT